MSIPDLPDDVVLSVRNVSKKFCRNLKRSMWYGIQDLGRNLIGLRSNPETLDVRPWTLDQGSDREIEDPESLKSKVQSPESSPPGLRPSEFWALRDISFELRRGECLGLIGRNGCGKTTLLRLIAGIFPPDQGEIAIRGRVGALIALGAGFHPHMTGRENVYLNGAILGLSQNEIGSQFDEIVDFAEIDEFIDAPVSTYSSGMRVRLGFAVATAMNPNLLLIDEVLAVGDTAFRDKCYRRIVRIKKSAAMILVSHNMEHVGRVCSNGLVMNRGIVVHSGSAPASILAYDKINAENNSDQEDSFMTLSGNICAFEARLEPCRIRTGESVEVRWMITTTSRIEHYSMRLTLYAENGTLVAFHHLNQNEHHMGLCVGYNEICCMVPSVPLRNGTYRVSFQIMDTEGDMLVWSFKRHSVAIEGAYLAAVADCQFAGVQYRKCRTRSNIV